MRFLVVIPTYNEIENLQDITSLILQHADETAKLAGIQEFHILIVDDNSPDGTGALAAELSKKDPRIFVIHRQQKEGLGRACISGFCWGIERKYDALCEMDADFSHHPKHLKDFFPLLKNHSVVIGSRYTPSGNTKNWSIFQRAISRGGNLYAQTMLGLHIQDLTGGYNVWKREVLEAIGLSSIESQGYLFQIEMKYRAWIKGFSMVETPIVFEEQNQGPSKISKKILLEAVFRIPVLRTNKNSHVSH